MTKCKRPLDSNVYVAYCYITYQYIAYQCMNLVVCFLRFLQITVDKYLATGRTNLPPCDISILGFDQPDHLMQWLMGEFQASGTSGLTQRFMFVFPPCLEKDLDIIAAPPQVSCLILEAAL